MADVRSDVKKIVQAAIKIAEGRDPELALSLLDNLPEGAISPKKLTEIVAYIEQFISAGPGAGGATGSG